MADTKSNEEEIASHFLKLNTKFEKEKYIKSLPKEIDINKIQVYLNKLSDKTQFAVIFYGKEKFSNNSVNEFKKERNNILKKLDYLKNDYKAVKNILNPLRKIDENYLIKEIIKAAYHSSKEYKDFYKSIHRAEKLAEYIREKKYNVHILNKVLSQNSELIKKDNIILDNLKDIFENDIKLKRLQPNLNSFLVKYIENEKPINDVIKNAEERILSGDISNVYNEIEKTEKLISQNILQALFSVYKSMNDMINKNSFIDYINEDKNSSFDEKDINKLVEKAHEYRNIILPKKWNEMKYKLKFTKKIEHYKAWFYGLREGRYKGVVSNVKEHIVNEMLKKIVKQITSKMKNIDIKSLSLVVLLNSKKKQNNELKKSYNEFLNISGLKDSNDPLAEQLKHYMSYYFYLNVDLIREKKIVDRIFENLKKLKTNKEKINLLNNDKKIDLENIQEEIFRNQIQTIYDNIIRLYELLENKTSQNIELKNIATDPNDAAGKFLNIVIQEMESNGKVDNLNEKINDLPDEISIDVLNALSFDPRFEQYFPQIEDTLYHKDWGRTFGVINLKVKEIEKKMGMIASEEFLDDLADRVEAKLGKNAFLAVKIRNMRKNLRSVHTAGTKKLHLLQQRLSKTKNSVEKILELQKISRDPRFKGVFGVIQNMERILIRDKFNEIYRKVKNLRLDTQVALFNGVKEDLQHLFEYEPHIINKVNNYIEQITFRLDNYSADKPKLDDKIVDAMDDFEKKELPLVELTDILDIETPDPDKYTEENLNTEFDIIDHDTNSGLKELDDLEMILQDINNDISFFKIDGSDESLELINQANNFVKKVDENIDKVRKLEELKESEDVNNVVSSVIDDSIEEDVMDKIEKLDYIFNENNYDTKSKVEGFIIAAEKLSDNNQKTQINEIVEVLRRIEKEVDPLHTIENKISKIVQWIENDYKDKIYIIDFLKKQIRELDLKRGREGGLLRKLLTGMENSEDKIAYLKEKLGDLEYQHLTSTIKTLIENIEKEMGMKPEEITDDWIINSLDNKTEDEQLDWLKVRKYWDKYEQHKDIIESEITKRKSKLKKIPQPKIYNDIIELTNALLEIDGKARKQSFIKEQENHLEDPEKTFKKQRRLLFYLFSADSEKPDDRLKALSNRITLSTNEKQELLKLLKKSQYENGSLQELLGIKDDRLAFYSAYVLYSNKPMSVRIKYLERFKTSDDPKVTEYKDIFGINDKIIHEVINFLNKSVKKNNRRTEEYNENTKTSQVVENEDNGEIIEKPEIEDIPDDLAEELKNEQISSVLDGTAEENDEEKSKYFKEEIIETDKDSEKLEDKELPDTVGEEEENIEDENFQEAEEAEEKGSISGKTSKDIINEQHMKDDYKKKEELLKKREERLAEEKRKSEEKRQKELEEEDRKREKEKKEKAADVKKSDDLAENNNKKEVEEEIEEVIEVKSSSSENAVKEQLLREEYDKKNEKIAKHIEELGKEKGREIVERIRERAHRISEDKNKKTEDKITDLLTYLTTCYPEAVSQIIKDEILPVFRDEGLNLNVHNLLESINDSIFKPAMLGKEVENNINFFSKSLTGDNVQNIRMIVEKIQNLWKDEEKKFDDQHDSFKNTLNEIDTGKGIESVLVYIDTIYPEGILGELDKNFVKKLSNEKIKIKSKMLFNFLKNILLSGSEDNKAKKELIKAIELKDKFKKNLDSVIKKIKNINIVNVKNEKIKKGRDQFINTKVSDSQSEETNQNVIHNEDKNINTVKIEDVMSKVNKFVKPHIFILDLVREDNELNEKDFNKDFRKSLINKMLNEGKIFSYDNGNTFIGRGHIFNLIKNNKIDREDGVRFINSLNEFLKKLKSDHDIFKFIGVKNESEYRQFNFLLDKLNVGEGTGGTSSADSEIKKQTSKKQSEKKQSAKKTGGFDIFSVFTGGTKKVDNKKAPKKNIPKKNQNINKSKIVNKKKNNHIEKKDDKKKYKDIIKDQKKFINKNQRELLKMASKEINKKIDRLIKSATTKVDLESIYKNYFGNSERNKKNLINLCYDIKQVAEIISKDDQLFSRLSFNKDKYLKMYNSKIKKLK